MNALHSRDESTFVINKVMQLCMDSATNARKKLVELNYLSRDITFIDVI